jgi:hypothetical protein
MMSEIEIYRQLRELLRTSVVQRGMELDRDGPIGVYECGVPKVVNSPGTKSNFDITPR